MKRLLAITSVVFLLLCLTTACGRKGPEGPPDKTPPTVTASTPAAGDSNIAVHTALTVTFSEAVDEKTLSCVLSTGTTTVHCTMTYAAGTTAIFTPVKNLAYKTLYTATVSGVTDLAGNPMSYDYIWSFETCPAPDTTPESFSFTPQTGVNLNTVVTSNSITVSGINIAALISIVGGEYSVNNGAYTAAPGTVNNGDMVTVHQTSSGQFGATTSAVLTIGSTSGAFSVTTLGPDTSPDPFTFTALTGVLRNTVVTSNSITVTGINTAAPIYISTGGEYSVNNGSYTAAIGTVNNGDAVTVQQTSSAYPGITTDAVLTIGGVSGTFSVATQ